jgi:hypothetical protein
LRILTYHFLFLTRKYGKLRAKKLTIVAVQAIVFFDHRRMISFCIKGFGKFKDFTGTVGDTVAAAFASVCDNVDYAPDHLYFMRIQWNPPVFHNPFLKISLLICVKLHSCIFS